MVSTIMQMEINMKDISKITNTMVKGHTSTQMVKKKLANGLTINSKAEMISSNKQISSVYIYPKYKIN
jgi:Cu/Ag efflux pump CusA